MSNLHLKKKSQNRLNLEQCGFKLIPFKFVQFLTNTVNLSSYLSIQLDW